MKKIFFIFLTTFFIFNTTFAEEGNQPTPPLSPLPQGEGNSRDTAVFPPPLTGGGEHVLSEIEGGEGERAFSDENQAMSEDEEMLYTPAKQMEEPGEILFTPVEVVEVEEIPYCPVRESEKPRGKFYAELTTTWQTIDLDTNSSKAQEYRKLTDGLYISDFTMNYESQNQEFQSKFGNIAPISNIIDDGYGNLNYRRFGVVDVSLGLAKFPHSYGNDAESMRDNYDLNVKFTPGDRLIITTSLTIENREGRRPITLESLTNSAATPSAIIEIAEPTDYTTASINLGLEYVDSILDLQFNNNLQIFSNTRPDEIIWDNPYQSDAFGRAKTADDYTVHTLSFKPSIKFTDKIRLINTLSFSKVTNSINLVPFTTVDGVGEAFQKDVLDPDVRSLNVSSILTTMPLSDVRLNIKYRYNAYENDTPGIEEPPAYVMLDGSSTKYARIPRYTSNLTRTLGIDGNWSVSDGLSVDAGIENRDTPRREREVEKENVKSAFLTINSILSDDLSGLIGYRYQRKRGDYDPTYYTTIYDTGSDVNQHPLLRAFDLSETDTHTVKAEMDFTPMDVLTLSASLSLTRGEYIDVIIGRKRSQAESASISAEYTPFKDFLVYSQYFYDRMTIESRYSWTYDSTLTASYPQETNSNFIKPISETLEDTSDSYVIGVDYDALKNISIAGNLSRHTSTGTSVNMPVIRSTIDTYELKLSYKFRDEIPVICFPFIQIKGLRINAGYYSERYKRDDYTLDFDVTDPEDIFLGITEPAYKLNIFSLSLDFSF